MTGKTIKISDKYNGPPGSGNGGYVAGVMACVVDAPCVTVRLRVPPPLQKELKVTLEGFRYLLHDGDILVAEAIADELDMNVPFVPTIEEAVECSKRYPGFERHAFPRCYVCGPGRALHDGLRLFTGANMEKSYVAAPFDTFPDLFDSSGYMLTEQICAALDCPGAYAISQIDEEKVLVLGQITVKVIEPILTTDQLIVAGWFLGKERKKNFSGTAIIDSFGRVKAIAKATWIEIDPDVFLNN